MKVKTVSVTYDRKFNLGDYNSATIGLTVWADVEENDDYDASVRRLQDEARTAVREEWRRLARKTNEKAG